MTTPPGLSTDAEIVRALRASDDEGVKALLAQHGPRILGALRGRFGSKVPDDMLQDALNDTAMGLLEHPQRLEDVGNLAGFVYVSVRNATYRRLETEQAQRHAPLPENAEARIAAPADLPDDPSRRSERIRAALEDLSPLERDVLDLDIASDFKMSAREIADALGTTEATVYATRNRIRSKLQKFMTKSAPNPTRA